MNIEYEKAILRECAAMDMTAVQAMNLLQNNGVVSDNCITHEDIADVDCPKAIEFLQGYPF